MDIPLQISFLNVEPSDAVRADIAAHAAKLEQFFGRIVSCRVAVEARNRHGHKGALYNVRLDIAVPGHEIAINRAGPKDHAHEDMHVAVRDAFAAAKRSLEDRARKARGDVKTHDLPVQGEVVRLFPAEGYGFVRTKGGEEIMFRRDRLLAGEFDKLAVGSPLHLSVPAADAAPDQAKSARTRRERH